MDMYGFMILETLNLLIMEGTNMPSCPFNHDECPEHNKKGGCQFWIEYSSKSNVTESLMKGCCLQLMTFLQLENANALGILASKVDQLSAELSAMRSENNINSETTRKQLVSLAQGNRNDLLMPKYKQLLFENDNK